jgi:hypothetical protein
MPGVIYGLVDRRTHEVRYIGKRTRKPYAGRLKDHLEDAEKSDPSIRHLHDWLKEAGAENVEFTVLEFDPADLNEAEIRWIAYGHLQNWPLTNQTVGGDGLDSESAKEIWKRPGYREARKNIEWKRGTEHGNFGKEASQETRQQMSDARRGKTLEEQGHKQRCTCRACKMKRGEISDAERRDLSKAGKKGGAQTRDSGIMRTPEVRERCRQAALNRSH